MKGWELLREIANGNIKGGKKFRCEQDGDIYTYTTYGCFNGRFGGTNVVGLLNCDFEEIRDVKLTFDDYMVLRNMSNVSRIGRNDRYVYIKETFHSDMIALNYLGDNFKDIKVEEEFNIRDLLNKYELKVYDMNKVYGMNNDSIPTVAYFKEIGGSNDN